MVIDVDNDFISVIFTCYIVRHSGSAHTWVSLIGTSSDCRIQYGVAYLMLIGGCLLAYY